MPGIHNIGKVLEYKLEEVGIDSYEKLCEIGTEDAFARIYANRSNISKGFLFAIEGAIQGVRTKYLSKERKAELLEFVKSLKANKNQL